MNKKNKTKLAALALCAFGSTALFANAPAAPAAQDAAKAPAKAQDAQAATVKVAQNDCKGKNECKGKGNCKTDTHGCKGQNACKGQGGCKSKMQDKQAVAATNVEKRANP